MKPRRLRDHGKPARRRRQMHDVLRFSKPLTVEQVRAIEMAWQDKAGRPASLGILPPPGWPRTTLDPLPTPWWKRWFR